MEDKLILLVEDNSEDEILTLRALKKNNIFNTVVVARDGAEALDYLFGTGSYQGRDLSCQPTVVLLDLKLPLIDGHEVLRRIRSDPRTRMLPVVILTSSKEEQDLISVYSNGGNSYIRKPVDFNQFVEAVRHLGVYWLVMNESPPVCADVARKPLRLLVVEDVEEDAELLVRDIRRGGYAPDWQRVEDEPTMREALANRAWDIVVADYSLPQFSALDALRIIKDLGADLPFIIVSGTIGEETAVEAMRSGAHDFIVKGKTTRLIPAIERELRLADDRRARREAEQALAENELRFRSLIENALDIITVIEPGGLIEYASPSALRVLGYNPAELIGRNVFELVFEQDQELVAQVLSVLMATDVARSTEIRVQRHDGAYAVLEAVGKRMDGSQSIVINARDITERKKAAQALQESNRRLQDALAELESKSEEMKTMSQQLWHTAKLATMGELAASIAHELNNPLATVSLRVETLLMGLPADDPRQRPLHIIEQEVERMTGLVANLLESSRRSKRTIAAVDVREEIEMSIELVQFHLRKRKVDLERHYDPDVPTVGVDRQELRQVLLNLLTNASDAMPDGGRLSLRVFARAQNGHPSMVRIECIDTGTGISPEDLARVLEPFFTTKEPGKGTGLGLAICRRIVQEHYGLLEIESQLGQGTVVRIGFPTLVET